MKIILSALLFIVLTINPLTAFCQELGSIRLSLLEGDVQVYSQDDGEWAPASINMPLGAGDRISVPYGGRVELQILGGIYLRLGDGTQLELLSMSDKDAHFFLDRGHIYINNKRGGIQTAQIDTPLATSTISDNSISLVDVDNSGDTDLSVIKGTAFMESRQGKTRVSAGTTLKVTDYGAELSPIASPDEWERWNAQRDRKSMVLGESARYLPDELHDYANDLDEHGRWLFVRDYGYVWSPAVVSFDWVPFRLGRWIWVRGDYTWVSDERWGWAPYHYGRWAHIHGSGWCWVPPSANAVAWGPGYVAWTRTSSAIGWVPLAPGETYYGRRSYGPGTVVISSRTPNQTSINQVYRNARISNAVTVVQSSSFSRRDRPHTIVRDTAILQQRNWTPAVPPPAPRAIRNPPAGRPSRMEPPASSEHRREGGGIQQPPAKATSFPVVPAPARAPAVGPNPVPAPGPRTDPSRGPAPVKAPPTAPATTSATPAAGPTAGRPQRGEGAQPRPFVRDSSQSVFKKDKPQQLPVKKLDEPKPVNRTRTDRRRPDAQPLPATPATDQEKVRGTGKERRGDN